MEEVVQDLKCDFKIINFGAFVYSKFA